MRDDRCQGPVDLAAVEPNRAPMDLAYAAAELRQKGWVVRIRDFPSEGSDTAAFTGELGAFKPDALCVATTLPTIDEDLAACRLARRICPEAFIVAKGPHLAVVRDIFLRETALDAAVYEEPEFTLARVLAAAPHLEGVPGVIYRRGGDVVANPPDDEPPSLDGLPLPARDLLRNDLYVAPDTGEPLGVILAGKGCPFDCLFCLAPGLNKHGVRLRSPEGMVAEMELCSREYGIKSYFLRADTFTLDRAWTMRFCRLVVQSGLAVRWGANSRIDTVDPELLAWMRRAGCWILAFGLESGSQEILERVGKRTTLSAAAATIRACRRLGIRTHCMYILGLPGETEETARRTRRFAVEVDSDFADFNVAYPMPGTKLYDLALARGLFDQADLARGHYAQPVMRTETLTAADLGRLRREAMRAFYLRPGYILRTLGRLRSPRELAGYLNAAAKLGRMLWRGEGTPLRLGRRGESTAS